jgi:hypothetical protein
MIAETRSVRRCTLKALGLPSGVSEEVEDGIEYDKNTEKPASIIVTPNNASRAAFITKCQDELKLTPEKVAEILKPSNVSIDSIKDYVKAFEYIKENMKESN